MTLQVFQIDTARVYCGGTAEYLLGKIDLKKRGIKIETKLYPTVVRLYRVQSQIY